MRLVAAALALGVAWFADAHLAALVLAALAWAGSWFTKGMPRVLLALVAPIILCAGLPSWGFDGRLLYAAIVALLGAVSFLELLGPAWPRPRAYAIVGAALGVTALFLMTPPGAVLASSDLAGGAIVLSLFAGVLGGAMLRVRG